MKSVIESSAVQEIVAALLHPGPLFPEAKVGWTAQELASLCPSVKEPHHASQILYVLGKAGFTQHGGGKPPRHSWIGSLPDCPEAWQPDRETLEEISRLRAQPESSGSAFAGNTDKIRQAILRSWDHNPGMPLSKKEILQSVRQCLPDCPEHPVSQCLYILVQEQKIRQHKEEGKGVVFFPAMQEDLVSLMAAKPVGMPEKEKRPAETGEASAALIRGMLPDVFVQLEDGPLVPAGAEIPVSALAVLDAEGKICGIRVSCL